MHLDGKDYSNDSDGQDFAKDSTAPPGTGTHTMAWQRIDGHRILAIFKNGGKEYQRAERAISQDGTTLTVHQWGNDRITGHPFG
jgi:hypothetical protein